MAIKNHRTNHLLIRKTGWVLLGLLLHGCAIPSEISTDETEVKEIIADPTATTDISEQVSKEPNALKATTGISHDQVVSLYEDCSIQRTDPGTYGLCGGGEGYEVRRNGEVLFFYWLHWQTALVDGIIVTSTYILVDDSLHVGMLLTDVMTKYPNRVTIIGITDNSEAYCVGEKNLWFDLDTDETTRAAEYQLVNGEYEFVKFKDTDKPVRQILIR